MFFAELTIQVLQFLFLQYTAIAVYDHSDFKIDVLALISDFSRKQVDTYVLIYFY